MPYYFIKMTHAYSKKDLRKHLRQQRRQLSPEIVKECSQAIARKISKSPIFRKSKSIALYYPKGKEIDLTYLLDYKQKQFYLPIVLFNKSLRFAHYNKTSRLYPNRFGIQEPLKKSLKRAQDMDLILVPLLGFDMAGNRLGMGAGFYDRTLQFRRWRGNWHKPYLLGVAYCFQQVESLPQDPWDIALESIVCI